jgi:thymidylate synthase (FAD)
MINEKQVHNHGFVKLLNVMGSDEEVENAARISYGTGTRKTSQTRNLIRYLMRHNHTSPFEMCEVKFHLKLPIFVMRQFVRHRTANINEYSGRYSIMSDEFYLPAEKDVHEQSEQNNQGRGKELDEDNKTLVLGRMYDANEHSQMCYKQIVDPTLLDGFYDGFNGIARELARTVLPVSNYTECIWKIDLNNFFKFSKLRMDSHSQKEIRDYANIMYDLVKPLFPISCEAFEDYILKAETFSAEEMKIIKANIKCTLDFNDPKLVEDLHIMTNAEFNLSTRERKEFLEKLKGI